MRYLRDRGRGGQRALRPPREHSERDQGDQADPFSEAARGRAAEGNVNRVIAGRRGEFDETGAGRGASVNGAAVQADRPAGEPGEGEADSAIRFGFHFAGPVEWRARDVA